MICKKLSAKTLRKFTLNLVTQDNLVKKANIEYTTLMKVENNTVNKPSVQTVAKIVEVLAFRLGN
jgi:DNA-binding XRE family transcriptional regulator